MKVQLLKRVENTLTKGENGYYQQFSLFAPMFSKSVCNRYDTLFAYYIPLLNTGMHVLLCIEDPQLAYG